MSNPGGHVFIPELVEDFRDVAGLGTNVNDRCPSPLKRCKFYRNGPRAGKLHEQMDDLHLHRIQGRPSRRPVFHGIPFHETEYAMSSGLFNKK